jgi:hypothetical protein
MKMIKWANDIIAGNLREAEKYIHMAHELKETNLMAADWCKEMAVKHLEFNAKGHELAKKLIADYAASGKNHELAPGMKVVYDELHAEMVRKNAEIMGMIAAYK